MGIVKASKALRALNNKVHLLNKRRESVRDKPRWDAKHGDELGLLRRQQAALTVKLMDELSEQGLLVGAGTRGALDEECGCHD